MALLPSSARPLSFPSITRGVASPNPNPNSPNHIVFISKEEVFGYSLSSSVTLRGRLAASSICDQEPVGVDLSLPLLKESLSDVELLAAVRLRIRTFYDFNESCGVEDYRRSLVEREYEALKERIAGKRMGFKRVSCINATIPSLTLLKSIAESLSTCKFSDDGKDHIIVGTLDVNQCFKLADELTGKKPEGIGADLRRAYLSNVCVAKELQRNGLGYSLVSKSKNVARQWGLGARGGAFEEGHDDIGGQCFGGIGSYQASTDHNGMEVPTIDVGGGSGDEGNKALLLRHKRIK